MFQDTEILAAKEASNKFGGNVDISISCIYDTLYVKIKSDTSPISFIQHGEQILERNDDSSRLYHSEESFLKFSESERVNYILKICDDFAKSNSAIISDINNAISQLSEIHAHRLNNLHIHRGWGDCQTLVDIDFYWQGYGDDLNSGEWQHLEICCRNWKPVTSQHTSKKILATLQYLATRDIRREKLAPNGLILDAPLRALLQAENKTEDELCEAAKAKNWGISDKGEKSPGPIVIGDHKVAVSLIDGKISSGFKLNNQVSWSKGCVTVTNASVPKSLAMGYKGRPVRDIIDHPWLNDLTITNITASNKKGGGNTLVITTKEG